MTPDNLTRAAAISSRDVGGFKSRAVEFALAALVLAAVGWDVWRLFELGYMPQPFHYDPAASLMDLYKPAFWANHTGAYDLWRAIYPPLSFVFLRIFSLHGCYVVDWFGGRQCDWLARDVLLAFFVMNAPLVYAAYRRVDPKCAAPRSVAVCLGLPMLYALDRGNLLIVCFMFFVLAEGGLVQSRILRWVAMGAALNFKPYLLVVALGQIARRHWLWLIGCGAASLAIYLVSFIFEGAGAPAQVLRNIVIYAHSREEPHYWASFYYATSYWPLAHMTAAGFSFTSALPQLAAESIGVATNVVIRAAQAGALITFIAACIRPSGVNPRRFTAMAAALALTTLTTGSSGYVQVFVLFLVFLEPWRGRIRPIILVASYLLCIPFDVAVWPVHLGPALAFMSGREVEPSFGVSVGQLLRPGLLLAIQFGLITLNLQDILGATRKSPLT